MKKIIFKLCLMVILALTLLGAPIVARWITDTFNFQKIDPDGAFMWLTVRHTLQAMIVLVLIVIIKRFKTIDFYLGLGDKSIGFAYLKKFMLFFTIYTVIAYVIIVLMGNFQPFIHDLNARNILGYLGFQLFLSGPSEEFIFRAFAMTMFAFLVTSKRIDKRMSYANLFAMIIFGVAHMRFSFQPFLVTFELPQVLMAMVLGYFYGDCYEKAKSFVYPMIMHSFSNVLMVGLTIILSFLNL